MLPPWGRVGEDVGAARSARRAAPDVSLGRGTHAARIPGIPSPQAAPMDKDRPNFFAGPYVDRRAEAREAADWLEAALADERTGFILGRGTTHLIRKEPRPT